jgi:single-stranded DNA-binding protein
MRAEEFITEWVVGNEQVGSYRVAIDSHLIQRQRREGREPVSTEQVLQVIKKLPQARGKFKQLGNGQQFWLHDNSADVSVGFLINDLQQKRFTAKNVWPGRSGTVRIPTFEVR